MSRRFYTTRTSGRTEINLRQEFNNMLDGVWPEIPKARNLVLRKMRRSNTETERSKKFISRKQNTDYFVPGQGYLMVCDCMDLVTQEPDLDNWCPQCNGESFLWDELLIDGYKVLLRSTVNGEQLINPGTLNIPLVVFYLRSHMPITEVDKIVEVWLDEEGQLIRPYRRKKIYQIGEAIDLRSDNGRIEYWKLECNEEQRKFLNGPKG